MLVVSIFLFSLIRGQSLRVNEVVIANGKMPNLAKGKNNVIHLVYGSGDSILYVSSKDGRTFTTPSLVAVLPGLFASAMRGPQIATTGKGIVITACTKTGNIFSYHKSFSGHWSTAQKVNDIAESAKEALMGLGADGENVFAVWLGVKSPRGQNVYGTRSDDGGISWKKNRLVYSSPDSTVCECCKPSVAVKGNNVYVMFRNWLNGYRDLYFTQSVDAGVSFTRAQKLGTGSWKLNGCPMDGGGLAIDDKGVVQTVWRREAKIYATTPGVPEKEIGEGRGCTIEIVNGRQVYAWAENGEVTVMKTGGIKKTLGKGGLPLLKALDNDHLVCVWENENQIPHFALNLPIHSN